MFPPCGVANPGADASAAADPAPDEGERGACQSCGSTSSFSCGVADPGADASAIADPAPDEGSGEEILIWFNSGAVSTPAPVAASAVTRGVANPGADASLAADPAPDEGW